MSRLSIRLRLALAFTAVLGVLLGASAGFVYDRLGADLDGVIDQGQRARAAELSSLAQRGTPFLAETRRTPLIDRDETFAEIVAADGRVLDASRRLPSQPLSADERARARRSTVTFDRRIRGFDGKLRLLATPVRYGDRAAIGVIGVALGDRNEALAALRRQLLWAAPVLLLIAGLLAYAFTAAALRPVEAMRRRAALLGTELAGARLPVPAARDELSRLGETLNELIGRLEATVERERRFTADASHELRTPLALLKTEIELALDGEVPRDALVAALRSTGDETERLIRLANQLLALARSDAGSSSAAHQPTGAAALMRRAADRFAGRSSASGRTITVVDPGPAVQVLGDPDALERALVNLVENALDHGAGTVTLRARTDGSAVELHVIDEGPGPEADELPHVFERFRRGRRARAQSPGAGLGLAVVSAIAAAHGGTAAAQTGVEGFDAWIVLPRE